MLVVNYYYAQGMKVETVMVAGQVDMLCGKIGDLDLSITGAAEHALEITHGIRTVKEYVTDQKLLLPYQTLPACLVIGLLMFSVFWINTILHKNSASTSLSPQTIMTGQTLTSRSKKHFCTEFGDYVQLYHNTNPHTSTDLVRAVSC